MGWMSNAPEVLKELSRRCQGHGGAYSIGGLPHATAFGRVAREAAVYPFKLCEAIMKGMRNQLRIQRRQQLVIYGYQALFDEVVTDNSEDIYIGMRSQASHCWDLSGKQRRGLSEKPIESPSSTRA